MARGCWPSGTDILTIPGELFAKFQSSFYADPVDAVFKALGVAKRYRTPISGLVAEFIEDALQVLGRHREGPSRS